MTYCAICTLSFLGKIPEEESRSVAVMEKRNIAYAECIRCIVSRQSTYLEERDEDGHQNDADSPSSEPFLRPSRATGHLPHLGPLSPDGEPRVLSPLPLSARPEQIRYVGFNGRPNKVVDTCYSFWNLGAIAVCEVHPCSFEKRLTKLKDPASLGSGRLRQTEAILAWKSPAHGWRFWQGRW